MIKYLILLVFVLTGCAQDPIKTDVTNNKNFNASLLFEYDGIKVYRFYDSGRYHWFTSKGECVNTYPKIICTGKTSIVTYEDEVI